MIQDLDGGTFGKVYTINVENGGVRLLDLPDWVAQATKDAVQQAQDDIIAGAITVSAIGDAAGMLARLDELFPR